eukprot:scaffold11021_cov132-Isochrysis_galbana.AAC.1
MLTQQHTGETPLGPQGAECTTAQHSTRRALRGRGLRASRRGGCLGVCQDCTGLTVNGRQRVRIYVHVCAAHTRVACVSVPLRPLFMYVYMYVRDEVAMANQKCKWKKKKPSS